MSLIFRDLIKKIGSGNHTHQDLTRTEAYTAMQMMLTQEATPAQIGAFLIAHRIKRPTGPELAGMLDAYHKLGPQLPPLPSGKPVVILSQPYDGRDRTIPLSPTIAILLSSVGIPVLQHGGDRMPTKEGIPLVDIWQGLGINWRGRSLTEIHSILCEFHLGFIYIPEHFPLAYGLVPYREQIGKRPPIATLELIWCPYAGEVRLMAGYVHPPTESMIADCLNLHGISHFLTIKGLEGSCDLPCDRTCIIGTHRAFSQERLLLKPIDYGMNCSNPPWSNLDTVMDSCLQVLKGETSTLQTSLIWNGGFYLWQSGFSPGLKSGLAQAKELITSGHVQQHLTRLRALLS